MSPERNETQPPSVTRTVPDRAGQGLCVPTPAEQRTARIMGISPAVQFEAGGKPFCFTLFSGAEDVVAAIRAESCGA